VLGVFILANLIVAVAKILSIVLSIYMWVIIIQAILSWVNPDPFNPIVRILYQVTEPVLSRLRRILPLQFGGMDFTPFVLVLVIIFMQQFLVNSLVELAVYLK
jgi:YggT family protein